MKSIALCDSYKELKALPKLTPSKKLKLSNIFDEVSIEVKNVQDDIINVHSIIRHDIDMEINQIAEVETKLKDSLKKIRYLYGKTTKHRDKMRDKTSKPAKFIQKVNDLEENVEAIKSDVDMIINNIVRIDSNLPKKSRILIKNTSNYNHYPLLFKLIEENHSSHLEIETSGVINQTGTGLIDDRTESSSKQLLDAGSGTENSQKGATSSDQGATNSPIQDKKKSSRLPVASDVPPGNITCLSNSINDNSKASDKYDSDKSSQECVNSISDSMPESNNKKISPPETATELHTTISKHQELKLSQGWKPKESPTIFLPTTLRNSKASTAITFETVGNIKF